MRIIFVLRLVLCFTAVDANEIDLYGGYIHVAAVACIRTLVLTCCVHQAVEFYALPCQAIAANFLYKFYVHQFFTIRIPHQSRSSFIANRFNVDFELVKSQVEFSFAGTKLKK